MLEPESVLKSVRLVPLRRPVRVHARTPLHILAPLAALAACLRSPINGGSSGAPPPLAASTTGTPADAAALHEERPGDAAVEPDSFFGVATISEDGAITLQLRSVTGGVVAEGFFVYPKSHPQYESVRKHVGPIKPGESKIIEPFLD